MNTLSSLNTLACGTSVDEPVAFIIFIFAVLVMCVVAAICSIFG